jgi:hypothetical protein
MAFGMPPGMADLLAKKYAIMQQQADAGMITANAASNLDNVRAGLLPGEVRANIAKTQADADFTTVQAGEFGATAAKQRALWDTQGLLNRANANQSMASARAMELGANYDFLGGYGSQVQGYRPAFRLTEGVGGTVSAPRAGMRRPGWNEDDPTGMRVFRGGL